MECTKEALLEQLWAIVTTTPADMMEIKDGVLQYKDTKDLTQNQKSAIASVEKSTTGLKIKLYDKLKALELLGKCLGLFDSRQEQTRENNLLETLLAVTEQEVPTYDLPELQQTTADRHDLVEQAEFERP